MASANEANFRFDAEMLKFELLTKEQRRYIRPRAESNGFFIIGSDKKQVGGKYLFVDDVIKARDAL